MIQKHPKKIFAALLVLAVLAGVLVYPGHAGASTVPQPVQNFVSTSSTDSTRIVLSWTNPSVNVNNGYTTFELTDGGSTVYYTGTATSWTHTGLTAGSVRHYSIRVRNASNQWSAPVTLTASTTPAYVGSVSVAPVANTGTQMTLSWPANGNQTGIEYWIYREAPWWGGGYSYIGKTTSTSYTDTGLQPNSYYRYYITPYSIGGSLRTPGSSSTAGAYTNSAAPNAGSYSGVTSTSFTANWSRANDYYSPDYYAELITVSNGQVIRTWGWNNNLYSWSNSSLTPDTLYSVRVRSRGLNGTLSPWTELGNVATLANQPSIGSFTNVTATSIRVNINTNNNPAGTTYEISRGGVVIYTGTNSFYDDTNLTPSTTYSYTVRARGMNTGVWTASSAAASQTTPPAVPTNITFSNITTNGFTVSWGANGNGTANTRYNIRVIRVTDNMVIADTHVSAPTTTWTISNNNAIAFNTQVRVEIRAENTSSGLNSAYATATTYTLANTPGSFSVTSVAPTSIALSWTANGQPSGNVNYATGSALQINYVKTYHWQERTWTAPAGTTIARVRFTGNIYSSDYTYVYYMQYGSWYQTAYFSGPNTWDQWFTVPAGTTQIRVVLNTSWTGLPATINVPEVELVGAAITNTNTYQLYRSASQNQLGTMVYQGTATAFTDTGLSPNTTYYYSVRALNGNNVPTEYATLSRSTTPPVPTGITASSGGLTWSPTEGRGWVKLFWPAVPGATGYRVWVWDGNAFRSFDVGNTLTWDSRAARIYPAESVLNGYADNSQTTDLFNRSGTGLDLRDTPNKLYLKTAGTTTDSLNLYRFAVSAYNTSGDSGRSANVDVTLPNRTDSAAPSQVNLLINDGQAVASGKLVKLTVSAVDSAVANYTSETGDDRSNPMWVQFSNDGTTWSNRFLLDDRYNMVVTASADPFFESLGGWVTGPGVRSTLLKPSGNPDNLAGGTAVELSWPGTTPADSGISLAAPMQELSPNTAYTFQVRYKLANLTNAQLKMRIRWTGPNNFSSVDTVPVFSGAADNQWREFSVQRTAPPGATGAELALLVGQPQNDTVLTLDYVQVVKGSQALPPSGLPASALGSLIWELDTSSFGKKTVRARVIDLAGNTSSVVTSEISYYLVDTSAPVVNLTIDSGSGFINSAVVRLTVDARDDLTQADLLKMRFSTDFKNWTDWETYSPHKQWTFTGGDGAKTVYVQVQDASGNVGTAYAQAALKTQGEAVVTSSNFSSPSGAAGTVQVNGTPTAVRFVQGPEVVLNMSNTGNATSVQYSLDNLRWTPAEPVSAQRLFTLPDWEGYKTVYARLSDGTVYRLQFVIDRTPPQVEAAWSRNATATTTAQAVLTITASDNFTPDTELMVSVNGGTTWLPYQQTVTVNLPVVGYNEITVMVRDKAGNVAKKSLGIFRIQ